VKDLDLDFPSNELQRSTNSGKHVLGQVRVVFYRKPELEAGSEIHHGIPAKGGAYESFLE
jgi:hypothetical protein